MCVPFVIHFTSRGNATCSRYPGVQSEELRTTGYCEQVAARSRWELLSIDPRHNLALVPANEPVMMVISVITIPEIAIFVTLSMR